MLSLAEDKVEFIGIKVFSPTYWTQDNAINDRSPEVDHDVELVSGMILKIDQVQLNHFGFDQLLKC